MLSQLLIVSQGKKPKWPNILDTLNDTLFHFSFLANLVAVFGEFDISGEFEKKRAVTKNVKRVIVHRAYDAATFENDLALLELESPVHFDSHIGEYTIAS